MSLNINALSRIFPNSLTPSKNDKNKKIDIAILSNGGGYTIPRAIKKIEDQTKSKAQCINYSSPKWEQSVCLTNEVKEIFNYINKSDLCHSEASRAEVFIDLVKSKKIDAPTCRDVIDKISQIAKNLDCIFLPGGENVPEIWYGGSDSIYDDHYRTLVELTLIHEARQRGIPLMGVCRGHQVIHVYHGKKLIDSPSGYYGNQTFTLIDPKQKGLLVPLFCDTVIGMVMHHQGVDIAEGQNGIGDLEPLTVQNDLVKAAESKYGAGSPVITTQFHPEMYGSSDSGPLSKNNEKFFEILHESAIVRNHKKTGITVEALVEARKNLKNPQKKLPPVKPRPSNSFIYSLIPNYFVRA